MADRSIASSVPTEFEEEVLILETETNGDEVAKKKKRRSAFTPGRKSLIAKVVDDAEEMEAILATQETLDDNQMKIGIMNQLIAEHKQEQLDWNNIIRTERKNTNNFLAMPDEDVITFENDPENIPQNYHQMYVKSRNFTQCEKQKLNELKIRLQELDDGFQEDSYNLLNLVEIHEREFLEECQRDEKERRHEMVDAIETLVYNDSGVGMDCTQ